MRKQKQKRKYNEVSYWESMADSMVGLLLCVLLVTMLLIMYLVRVPDEKYTDQTEGSSFEDYQDPDAGGGNHANGKVDDEEGDHWDTKGGKSDKGEKNGGSSQEEGDGNHRFDDPDPGAGDNKGTDRAAVFVQVVDGETGRTIKKQGVEFELYNASSALLALSTYYPEKIEYKSYETDKSGTFYLPEKIALGGYSLHALSTITGYDLPENTAFTIDKPYDWDEPYVVSATLYPSKNSIHIQVKDADNGDAVSGATFQVIAAENIITQDGTTRYTEGQIVDTISTDEDGSGKSMELYLGNYLLRQETVPQYYGRITTDTPVTVVSKSESSSPVTTELSEEKTSVRVSVTDALKNTEYLEDAKFVLTEDDGTVAGNLTTDKTGRFTLTDLKKNTTYHLQQTETMSGYQLDTADHTFTVSGDGLIDGKTEMSLNVKNRIIRISIGVKDRLFRGQVSDVNVAVRDASGNVVKTWNTTGLEQQLEGLAEGDYQVILDGKENQAQTITVQNVTEIQTFQFDRWTVSDIGALLAVGMISVAAFVTLFITAKHRREKRAIKKE